MPGVEVEQLPSRHFILNKDDEWVKSTERLWYTVSIKFYGSCIVRVKEDRRLQSDVRNGEKIPGEAVHDQGILRSMEIYEG